MNLTQGVSETQKIICPNQGLRKDMLMWKLFLSHWNGVSLFLPPFTESSPQIHLYTDTAGSIGYGAFFNKQTITSGSMVNGSPPIRSTLPPALVLPGKNSTQSNLPACYGPPSGLTKGSVFTAITKQQ